MPEPRDLIIGIDLGTTNSLAAYSDAAGPAVLKNVGDGSPTDAAGLVPSVVHFATDGSVLVGAQARAHAIEFPLATVYSIKRLMGIGWDEAQNELKHLAYRVVPTAPASDGTTPAAPADGGSDIVFVEVHGRRYSPQEISALILRAVKHRAELHFQRPVTKAVITVPAYFNDSQRQATKDAGRIAGLDVVRIVNEPTAAALAYGLGERAKSTRPRLLAGALFGSKPAPADAAAPAEPPAAGPHLIAVYDLGGGTFDVSILQLQDGVFQVLSTHGDTHLGGDDLDRELIGLFHREIEARLGHALTFPPSTRQALRDFAEAAKIRLSTAPTATVEIAVDRPGADPFVYRRTVTREEFEGLIAPWVERTLDACRTALRDAGRQPADIAEVVLVGGCTRIPLVKQRVGAFFGRTPYDAINPDEVVALGAAVQASILAGVRRDVLLLDVVPLSLGIETMGGAMGKLIMKNTPIPAVARELFSTFVDGQTRVAINVLQGERELARDCRSLGRFELTGLPPMPAGLPKIEVTFLIDANGILNVSAVEQRSGVRAGIQVVPAHGLTTEQVDRLTAEAVEKAREDFAAHRLIDLRLHLTRDMTAAERDLKRAASRLSEAERIEIEELINRLSSLRDSADADALQAALDAMNHSPARIRLAEAAITAALQGS